MRASVIKRVDCRAFSGLTLLELMVVLVILAVVATVAMQTMQPRVESERYQSAARMLENIRTSVLGPTQKYQVDGTPLISGFVSDVGRLPTVNNSSMDNAAQESAAQVDYTFVELWGSQSNLALSYPFQFRPGPQQPVDYSKIELPCGWRGPYLQLQVGATALKDPWGVPPIHVLTESGQIGSVQIQLPPTTITTEPHTLVTDLANGKVSVNGKIVMDRPEESSIRVALLAPSPNSSLTHLVVLDDENQAPDSFSFSDVPIGLRAIVADVNGQRYVKYIQVAHDGANVVFDLTNRGN